MTEQVLLEGRWSAADWQRPALDAKGESKRDRHGNALFEHGARTLATQVLGIADPEEPLTLRLDVPDAPGHAGVLRVAVEHAAYELERRLDPLTGKKSDEARPVCRKWSVAGEFEAVDPVGHDGPLPSQEKTFMAPASGEWRARLLLEGPGADFVARLVRVW